MGDKETGTAADAEKPLREWAEHNAKRDDIIRQAREDGINNRRIAQLMGISRTTVYTVLDAEA